MRIKMRNKMKYSENFKFWMPNLQNYVYIDNLACPGELRQSISVKIKILRNSQRKLRDWSPREATVSDFSNCAIRSKRIYK